ncbi:MAG TPA: phosphoserine phosphatase SerB [Vicinamibacterales bacterium]|nr:phosphoserine phosphatase SerB [Vicinamibacterales bacterium]
MQEIVLLHITGEDRPGLTTALTGVLASHGIRILDMNQTVIHRTMLMGMLVQIPPSSESTALLKDLLFTAHHMGLQLRMTPVEDHEYDAWVGRQGKPRFILTLLARQLMAEHIAAVSRLLAEQGMNIDVITRLSGRPPHEDRADTVSPQRACVEFSVRGQPRDEAVLREELMAVTRRLPIDLSWQRDDVYRRTRRLVAFDMDSTLIQHEVIDELAKEAGSGPEVAAITEAAMHGEIAFDESLRRRVATLAGLPASVLPAIAARLTLSEGAERLVASLKSFGYKTAIISGGFSYFGKDLQRRIGIDHVCANELEIVDGVLTGRVAGPIINAQRKAELLREIASKEGIALEQTIAVGDGANDLPMLGAAGLGIAFRAKPIVAQSARHHISQLGLDGILYLLGVRDRELIATPTAIAQ